MAVSVEGKIGSNTGHLRLTIHIDLSGFSFEIKNSTENQSARHRYSKKFPAEISCAEDLDLYILEIIDSHPLLSKEYESVILYYSTEKYSLVPDLFFEKDKVLVMLKELHQMQDMDEVSYLALQDQGAVLLYAIPNSITSLIFKIQKRAKFYPLSYSLIQQSLLLFEYNRVLAYYSSNLLHIVASEGDRLLLSSTYYAQDFTTVQYYLLLVIKEVMFNPKQTILRIGNITSSEVNALKKCFKDVQKIGF